MSEWYFMNDFLTVFTNYFRLYFGDMTNNYLLL